MKSIKRDRGMSLPEFFNYIILIVGMLVIAVVLALLVRIQRGLLGIILAVVAVGLLVYWISELRKTVKKEFSVPSAIKWSPDILHQGDEIIVVGAVPGPEKKVKVEFRNGILEVRGGQRFREFVTLGEHLNVEETKYVNGVLQVRLGKESCFSPSVEPQ
jgi:uncharacterized membrane protein YraQ (UPF0718 family)